MNLSQAVYLLRFAAPEGRPSVARSATPGRADDLEGLEPWKGEGRPGRDETVALPGLQTGSDPILPGVSPLLYYTSRKSLSILDFRRATRRQSLLEINRITI